MIFFRNILHSAMLRIDEGWRIVLFFLKHFVKGGGGGVWGCVDQSILIHDDINL